MIYVTWKNPRYWTVYLLNRYLYNFVFKLHFWGQNRLKEGQTYSLLAFVLRCWTSPRSFNLCDMEESEVLDSLSSKSISWEELRESLLVAVFIPWLLPFPLPVPLLPFPVEKVWFPVVPVSRITSKVLLWEVWWLSPPKPIPRWSVLLGGDFWYVEFRPRPALVNVELTSLLNVELRPWLWRKPEI